MPHYIAGRLTALLPVLLFVSVFAFIFIRLLPGDPVVAMLGPDSTGGIDPQTLAAKRHQLGLDKPLPIQYVDWVGRLLVGDFGRSAVTHQPVRDVLTQRFPVTLQLSIASFIVALIIGIPVGVVSAYKRNGVVDRLVSLFALTGVAMPSFWLGILLILLFAVELGWFPPSGYVSFGADPAAAARHLVLPAVSLGLVQAAVLMRQTRSGLLEVLREDYIRTARAKGLAESRVLFVHGLRNAMLPVVTIIGLQVSRILSGAVVVETVFAMPGLGRYAVDAIFSRDYPVVQVVVLITAFAVVAANLLTDLVYMVLDPRIKLK